MNLVQKNGKTRVKAKYIYRNPPEETLSPENSNIKTAISRTNMIYDRLIKKGQLDKFQEEIQKKIDIGCLQRDLEEQVLSMDLSRLIDRRLEIDVLVRRPTEQKRKTDLHMQNNGLRDAASALIVRITQNKFISPRENRKQPNIHF